MINDQIISRGITDQTVIRAMSKISRELFVTDANKSFAYVDTPLPIGCKQTISQPYIVALMTELCHLNRDSTVLEIGTGSGYQTAVLAEIARSVYSVELIPELYDRASILLDSLGYKNILLKCDDGYRGWFENAPFDAIIVTAAPEYIPDPFIEQLKTGGRLVIPVGAFFQRLFCITKLAEGIKKEKIIDVRFVPLISGS